MVDKYVISLFADSIYESLIYMNILVGEKKQEEQQDEVEQYDSKSYIVCPIKVSKVSNSKKLQVQEILVCWDEMNMQVWVKVQNRRLVNVEKS